MSAKIKRDDNKQKWEDTEFPLVCETCLGDNPYVRMTKEPYGKKCQVCETPFTVFAWQAGTKGRLKRVEICKSCAQAKNVCQVCIYDLQYGLPVKVRDRVLREHGAAGATTAVPQSMANRAWYTAQQERALEQGQNLVGEANALAVSKLQEMAQMQPRYERNMAKLCSFFARGECNRGDTCPFRHELPKDRNDPLSKQDTKSRFYGTEDPVANKMIRRQRMKEAESKREDEEGYDKARATLYLRFDGDSPYPPLTEPDIRDQFYSFGEIVSVRTQPGKGQAFVEYTQPEAAELAIASMNRKSILNRPIQVKWARAPKRGDHDTGMPKRGEEVQMQQQQQQRPNNVTNNHPSGGISRLPPPPGARLPPPPRGNDATTNKSHVIPQGLTTAGAVPAHVAAIAAARRNKIAESSGGGGGGGGGSSSIVARPSSSSSSSSLPLPRPGGGPIRRVGAGAARPIPAPRLHYPSADPGRLGTKTDSNASA
jgi:pre-mRNA-splicing factor RBM22/SLT11